MPFYRSISNTLRELGWRTTMVHATDRILRALNIGHMFRYVFYHQPVAEPVDRRFLSRTLQCRELEAADLALLPEGPDVINYRLSEGGIAVGAFKDGECIATLWYTMDIYNEDEVRARYQPLPHGSSAWDFGVGVAPQYRIGRTFVTLWDAGMASMRSHGCTASFSRINATNAASITSHAKLGARPLGCATFLTLGPVQVAWSSHTPRFHISLSKNAIPLYQLQAPVSQSGPQA